MEEISLSKNPNCIFTVTRDGCTYGISLRLFGGMTFATVTLNGNLVASGVRCVPNSWIIPYTHSLGECGNLRFECSGENYPTYETYGLTAHLMYYAPAEYRSIMGG